MFMYDFDYGLFWFCIIVDGGLILYEKKRIEFLFVYLFLFFLFYFYFNIVNVFFCVL